MNTFTLALCQIKSSPEKEKSREKAGIYVTEAAKSGANIVSLPEMWNCPYANEYFRPYAEPESGETVSFMSKLAKGNGIWLIGGTIPEIENDRIYNTCYIIRPDGSIADKHRKAHLFDIDVKGGIRFMESEVLTGGDKRTVITTEYGKIGIAICYDVRFPKLFSAMSDDGAKLIILPAAFNMTTGPAHWELLMRSRALDNQLYFAACSPARDLSGVYQAFGHSCIVNPWGEYCGKTDSRESIVYGKIDFDYVDEVRGQIPIISQRKPELY